MSTASMVPCTL